VSLGLGRIELAILAMVDVEDEYEQSYAAEDLAINIFRPENPSPYWWPNKAQYVGVVRAMHSLARKYPRRFALTGGKGHLPLWLNVCSRVNCGRRRGRSARRLSRLPARHWPQLSANATHNPPAV
jgi:hypothetical protein